MQFRKHHLLITTLALALTPVYPATSLKLIPDLRHQTMVGFGGALTWYSPRVLRSPHADEINQLLFEDLGLDIVRFQNWYFPADYPNNKDTAGMADESNWSSTEEFYQLAKAANPDIKVLLSSWGPPAALKSNNDQRNGGTLKKVDGQFVYNQYAQYWADTFDHLSFVPDYLSIQNEPGYSASWTSCVWRPTETTEFAGYDKAIDAVHDILKDRPEQPVFVGAEAENIGQASWDNSLNTFREFTTPLKDRNYVQAYAYHIYNIWRLDKIDTVIPRMNMIRDEFGEKPNFMTEYSREFAGWLETARIIQNNLMEANTSAYIHWKLVWNPANNPDEEDTMISITNDGQFEIKENYYALKHFSKFIDIGYIRLELESSDSTLRTTAFVRPDGRRLVLQAVNSASIERPVEWDLQADIATASAIRSTEGNYFVDLGPVSMATQTSLPAESLTTYVIDLNASLLPDLNPVVLLDKSFDLPGNSVSLTVENQTGITFTLWKSSDLKNWIPVSNAEISSGETTTTLTDSDLGESPSFYRAQGSY
jgi:glucuronoarabinoxylan endo-1,4-beta-xylanase